MNSLTDNLKSPLYGRSSLNLTVSPLPFRATASDDYRRSVERYAVTGGMPYHMSLMSDGYPVEDLIRLAMDMINDDMVATVKQNNETSRRHRGGTVASPGLAPRPLLSHEGCEEHG